MYQFTALISDRSRIAAFIYRKNVVPIRDENPIYSTPVVVYALIALNVAIFFYEASLSGPLLQLFINTWALVPAELTCSLPVDLPQSLPCEIPVDNMVPEAEWITLFSSQFLHGSLVHLGGNMLFLWVFGNNIEDKLGSIKFLLFYLACGALAALSQWIFEPGSIVPTVGASGAIAGVMGAYILRFPRARIMTIFGFFIIPVPAYLFLGWWFIQQSFYSYASLGATVDPGTGGVAYWAHAGGFVFGAILGPLMGLFADKRRDEWK